MMRRSYFFSSFFLILSLFCPLRAFAEASYCEVIKVCTHYQYVGPSYHFGDRALSQGDSLPVAIPAAEVLEWCKPVWREFPGWKQSLKGIASFQDLPEKLRTILDFVVTETGVSPRMISIGPDRQETIFV